MNNTPNKPNISVIIPVYNVDKYINECMDSVLSQTLCDIEVICVNDGSTDDSLEILQKFALTDCRVKIICQSNLGAGIARNRGLKEAVGEYVIFFDSDDYMSRDALMLLFKEATANCADITVGRSRHYIQKKGCFRDIDWSINSFLINENRCFNPKDYASHAIQIFVGWPWDKLYKRDFLLDNKFQFPNLVHSEDTSFVLASVVVAERICYIDNIIFTHRQHVASLENNRELNPTCFYDALCLLHESISSLADFKLFEQSFINYCLSFSKWQIETTKGIDTKNKMLQCFYNLDNKYNLLSRDTNYYYDNLLVDLKQDLVRSSYAILLLAIIPILTVTKENGREIYRLFGVLPLYKIKRYSEAKRKHFLFGVIPFLKIIAVR